MGRGPDTEKANTLMLRAHVGGRSLAVLTPLFVLAPALLAAAPAAGREPAAIPLAEIRPGMTGYGLTVFEGSRVDTFGVTVVGIQHNPRVAGSLLLIEVAGHGLELSSIAQGMSGSPIYLDGRFAGALAFGWEGALRPLAGVTPAEDMLALPRQAGESAAAGMATPNGTAATGPRGLVTRGDGGLGRTLFGSASGGAAPVSALPAGWPAPDVALEALLADAGLAQAARGTAWIYQPLGAATAATGAGADAPPLRPGSACAVPLVTGDALLGAIGTVTWVEGDRVLMMGHPFMQRGPVDLPLAAAEILTVFPSRSMSFKMGSIGEVVGTVHHDLRAGLAGRLGAGPAMVPVTVRIHEDGHARDYEFRVVHDPQLTPVLTFWTIYNALLARGDDASDQTVRYGLQADWERPRLLASEPLVLRGAAAGPGGAAALAGEWMAPLAMLLNNPHEDARLRGVTVDLTLAPAQEAASVVDLSGPRAAARGGGELVFDVTVQPRRGGAVVLQVPLTLPAHLPAGSYRVAAASAADVFALEAQRAAGAMQPGSLRGLQALLARERSADRLMLAVFAPGGGVIVDGREMSSLPGSVAGLLEGGQAPSDRPLADFVLQTGVPTGWVLSGHAVRTLELLPSPQPVDEEKRP